MSSRILLWSALWAALFGALVALALFQIHYAGQPQSYDTLLYSRGLWGVAHGNWHNPIFDLETFAIHGSFVFFLLAPLAHIMSSANVLIAAQAVSLAGVVFVTVREAGRVVGEQRTPLVLLWFAPAFALSPLILNPSLFGARPEHIGVLLLTVGLLRIRRTGLDPWAALLLALAPLAREELGLVAAAGVLFAPSAALGVGRAKQLGMAAGCAGYTILYWALLQGLFAGEASGAAAFNVALLTQGASQGIDWGSFLPLKAEILIVFGLTAGLLASRGWRWLGATIPGLALMLIDQHHLEHVIVTHYAALMVPGLAVASIDGLRRWSESGNRAVFVGVSVVATVGAYLVAGAAPLGGRYDDAFWQLDVEVGSDGLSDIGRAHALVSTLPPDDGVVSSYIFATTLADRPVIWPLGRLTEWLAEVGELPEGISWVVLLPQDFATLGRVLVNQHGLRLVALEPGAVAIVGAVGAQRIPWETARALQPPGSCESPLTGWRELGLIVCRVEGVSDGRMHITLQRIEAPTAEMVEVPLGVQVTDPTRGWSTAAVSLYGLINVADLPVGQTLTLRTDAPVPEGDLEIQIVTPSGQMWGLPH